MNIKILKTLLADFYHPHGDERVGFIRSNNIIEVKNESSKPDEGFMVSCDDIERYTELEPSQATWHTHPGKDSNLSGEDYKMIVNWPDMLHFIIGNDGVKVYKFDDKKKAVVEVD